MEVWGVLSIESSLIRCMAYGGVLSIESSLIRPLTGSTVWRCPEYREHCVEVS